MLTVQTESKPLNACPFCGGKAKLFVLENENVPEQEPDYLVICQGCGAEGPCSDNPFKAEKWWNGEMKDIATRERRWDGKDELLTKEENEKWNKIFRNSVRRGDDHGYAAFLADQAIQRMKS